MSEPVVVYDVGIMIRQRTTRRGRGHRTSRGRDAESMSSAVEHVISCQTACVAEGNTRAYLLILLLVVTYFFLLSFFLSFFYSFILSFFLSFFLSPIVSSCEIDIIDATLSSGHFYEKEEHGDTKEGVSSATSEAPFHAPW